MTLISLTFCYSLACSGRLYRKLYLTNFLKLLFSITFRAAGCVTQIEARFPRSRTDIQRFVGCSPSIEIILSLSVKLSVLSFGLEGIS